ncbi:hypothetical protein BKA59DRAFT_455802 [Fusarium tricinctum]|uniref:Cyanovirin-N domain-containing protein n=1 Tax=Fusarium tricinctum TaxID=61284 RepID=A0A8K0S2U6_9HYPO|nr:hypothetical protein BKA59DRAFT_455802 [Fusarium tricinctum]
MHLFDYFLLLAFMATSEGAPTSPENFESTMSLDSVEFESDTTPIRHPLVPRSNIKVGYGEQIQNGDETNYWVAWLHGHHACPGQSVIKIKDGALCDTEFWLGKAPNRVNLRFLNCDGQNPTEVYAGNSFYGSCGSRGYNGQKISCKNQHDIKQHGFCE